jgi:DNA-binding NarL/FixJ family response regulator
VRTGHAGNVLLDFGNCDAVYFSSLMVDTQAPLAVPGENPLLTAREKEVFRLVARGFCNRQVAGKLSLREQTVKNYLRNIFKKLGVSKRRELSAASSASI